MSNARELAKAGGSFGAGGFVGMKNRIINGDMRIDQRNSGASVALTDSLNTFAADRWSVFETCNGSLSFQQVTDAPSGFNNSLKFTVTTAASIVAADYCQFKTTIEGYNFADLGFGTANAKTTTVSFWVKSSLTGQFGGSYLNSDVNRAYPFSYVISSANTWEQKTITIPGDTSGTWLTTNGVGLYLMFDLGMGSNRLGAANAWASGDYRGAIGDTKLIQTNGATFQITGVQLEKGPQATPFEFRHYGTELALCQRYFVLHGTTVGGYTITLARGFSQGNAIWRAGVNVPVPMRSTPSISYANLVPWNSAMGANTLSSIGTVYMLNGIDLEFDCQVGTSWPTSGLPAAIQTNGSGGASYLSISAEL